MRQLVDQALGQELLGCKLGHLTDALHLGGWFFSPECYGWRLSFGRFPFMCKCCAYHRAVRMLMLVLFHFWLPSFSRHYVSLLFCNSGNPAVYCAGVPEKSILSDNVIRSSISSPSLKLNFVYHSSRLNSLNILVLGGWKLTRHLNLTPNAIYFPISSNLLYTKTPFAQHINSNFHVSNAHFNNISNSLFSNVQMQIQTQYRVQIK